MAEYKGLSGKLYQTQNAPFAGGGEGDVYDVIGAYSYVAKVYKPDKRTTERERKLSIMVSNKPSVMEQYAWPIDVLYENGQFIGYVMPKINGKEKLRNIYVYDKRKGKPWSLFIAIAKNLSAAVHNVHEIHQVVGDLNPENILVNPKDGMVTLVDTDSYHISDSNRTYRCGVGMPEFVAPELQGIHFPSAPLPTFTPESDRFALAVLIFALLMNGAHPFSCKVISGSSSKFQPIDNMQNGKCAFFSDSRSSNMDIPRYAPELSSLPNNIQRLFRRAFVAGRSTPSLRPSAEEWYNALEQLEDNLKTCLKDTQHIYYYGAKECPWCKVNEKMRFISQSVFNSFSQSGSNSGSGFQPATAGGQAQQFMPSSYKYTPSSSVSGSQPSKKKYGGIPIVIVIIVFMLIIKSCINTSSGNKNNDDNLSGVSGYSYRITNNDTSDKDNSEQNTNNYALQETYVEDAWLTDLDYVKKGSVTIKPDSTGQSNTGIEYSHYMFSTSPYSEIVYQLNGDYDTLTALWSICYTNRNTIDNNSFEIYADEVLVYSSPSITGGDIPVDVSVDISGCNLLTILFKEGIGCAELANIRLSTNTNRTPNGTVYEVTNLPCWLTDLDYLTNSEVSVSGSNIGATNTGDTYSHYMSGSSGSEIVYYLNGGYSRLTGLWTICQTYKDTNKNNSFEIYADNNLVYSSPSLTGGDLPVEFEADINNCEKLRIVFTNGNGAGELGNIRIYPGEDSSPINRSVAQIGVGGTWLTDLDYLMNNGVSLKGNSTGTTNTGENYSHYMFGSSGSEIVYYLNGKYSSISGLWTICQTNRDTNKNNSFELYADEVLVYSSPALTGGDLPITFDVGINGCQKLKIVFTAGNGAGELGNISLK